MILIFGGTTEGRLAAAVCDEAGKTFYYSTKGELQHVEMLHGVRLTGAMTVEDIRRLSAEKDIRCIVDAAHPFALGLHQTIARSGLPVVRLQRELGELPEGAVVCRNLSEALQLLNRQPAKRLLALTGVNSIAPLKPYWSLHPTLFRILPRTESRAVARREGFPEANLVFYNAEAALPTVEVEMRMMEQTQCDTVLTKQSGTAGGFETKVEAARRLGLRLLVVTPPRLPQERIPDNGLCTTDYGLWTTVTGRHGLRRALQHLVPGFFPLSTGLTTGACATAAVKAALLSLLSGERPCEVDFALPDGENVSVPVEVEGRGMSSVVKEWNDDPDVTRGCRIRAQLEWDEGNEVTFLQGEGVGRVTLPGLGIPVGEPAINPTPRSMIRAEIRRLTDRGVRVTLSVEGGRQLALRTFNPRVGVEDGISIIGTSGIVTPLSNEAFVESIGRELQVARAMGLATIGLASGQKGEEALHRREPSLRVIHYGNFVGAALRRAHELGFRRAVIGILIGKAVKLAEGHLDTHSHRVQMNRLFLVAVADELGIPEARDKIMSVSMARQLPQVMPPAFFERIKALCLAHCRTVFPTGELEILLQCDTSQ